MSKQLRNYQIKSHEASANSLSKGISRQLNVMATGTGKTYTEVKLIEKYNFRKPTLWITHTEELLEQSGVAFLKEKFDEKFAKHIEDTGFLNYVQQGGLFTQGDFRMGAIKAEVFQPYGNIVMASAQTLHRRLDRLKPDQFDYIVCDEAHLFGAPTFIKSIEFFKPKLLRGLTATPHRADGMLPSMFDEITFDYDIGTAIKDGNLCELDAVRIKTTTSLDKVRTTAGELNAKDLADELNTPARNQLIAASYKKYADGRQFVAFCVDIQHALDLAEVMRQNGISCKTVTGSDEITPNRSQTIRDLKERQVIGLTNCMVLTAGFDHPNIGCIIMACPTKSLTKFLQCVGRGTRLKDQNYVDKFGQNCIILDIIDNTSRHRLVNAWELDRSKPADQKVFITDKSRKILLDVEAKRKVKLGFNRDEDERVDLLKLPKVKKKSEFTQSREATPKQLEAIARWGYDIVNIQYTMGMIDDIFMEQMATDKQIWALKKAGYDVSRGVTIVEAKLAFKEIENRKAVAETNTLYNQLPFSDL